MGFPFNYSSELSFHHLIIPRSISEEVGFADGNFIWNGVLLKRRTSHDYLHTIERYNQEMFFEITSEMLDEVIKGSIDLVNIQRINSILLAFEKEFDNKLTRNKQPIVRKEYLERIR